MKASIRSTAQRLGAIAAVLAAAAALPAGAQAARARNALDPTFGTHGRVEHWVADKFSNARWSGPSAVYRAGRGRVVVAAPAPVRLTAGGALDRSFGTGGVLPDGDGAGVQRLPDGAWLTQSGADGAFRLADADGHPLASSPALSASLAAVQGQPWALFEVVGLAGGDLLALHQPSERNHTVIAATLGRDGTVKRDGVVPGVAFWQLGATAQFPVGTGAILRTVFGVMRLRGDGSLDPRWGQRLVMIRGDDEVLGIAPWGHGGVAMLSFRGDAVVLREIGATGHVVHRRTLAHNAFTTSYGDMYHYTLATDAQGRVLVARTFRDRSAIRLDRYNGIRLDKRFGTRGTVDLRASKHVASAGVTVLPDGRIVVLGQLQKFGTMPSDRADFDSPDWEPHGTVVWRVKAR
jgi:hypothetical protein